MKIISRVIKEERKQPIFLYLLQSDINTQLNDNAIGPCISRKYEDQSPSPDDEVDDLKKIIVRDTMDRSR